MALIRHAIPVPSGRKRKSLARVTTLPLCPVRHVCRRLHFDPPEHGNKAAARAPDILNIQRDCGLAFKKGFPKHSEPPARGVETWPCPHASDKAEGFCPRVKRSLLLSGYLIRFPKERGNSKTTLNYAISRNVSQVYAPCEPRSRCPMDAGPFYCLQGALDAARSSGLRPRGRRRIDTFSPPEKVPRSGR